MAVASKPSGAAGWFMHMQKLRVQVTRRCDRDRLEHLTHIAPVVSAVGDDVQEHFFPRHQASVTVGELKCQGLGRLLGRQASGIGLEPGIGLRHFEVKFGQCGRGVGVGSAESMGLAPQMRLENAVHHIDVVQGANRRMQGDSVAWRVHIGQHIEQLVVGPGLVGKKRLEGFHDYKSPLCDAISLGSEHIGQSKIGITLYCFQPLATPKAAF
jgi:hypothetical protein